MRGHAICVSWCGSHVDEVEVNRKTGVVVPGNGRNCIWDPDNIFLPRCDFS